ncbi:MAG TPA: ester cyclase [Chloroflexia bacterium]|nr:ester cyclase [Chloroflexia bacterium]
MNTLDTTTPATSTTGTEANGTLVRRFYELAWAKADFGLLDEMLVADYMHHDPALPPEWQRGRESYKQITGAFTSAFPDLSVVVEDLVAQGDRVAARWTWEGTQQGAFQGIPATGKHVTGPGLSIHRIVEGQIAETWISFDALGLMQQLGVIPVPGAGGG